MIALLLLLSVLGVVWGEHAHGCCEPGLPDVKVNGRGLVLVNSSWTDIRVSVHLDSSQLTKDELIDPDPDDAAAPPPSDIHGDMVMPIFPNSPRSNYYFNEDPVIEETAEEETEEEPISARQLNDVVSARMTAVINFLQEASREALGEDRLQVEKLQTTRVSLVPVYTYRGGERKFVGYTATQTISFRCISMCDSADTLTRILTSFTRTLHSSRSSSEFRTRTPAKSSIRL